MSSRVILLVSIAERESSALSLIAILLIQVENETCLTFLSKQESCLWPEMIIEAERSVFQTPD